MGILRFILAASVVLWHFLSFIMVYLIENPIDKWRQNRILKKTSL